MPWLQPLQSAHVRFSFLCGQGVQVLQFCFSLPCGHGLQATQLCFTLPCGQGVQVAQKRFCFPWGHINLTAALAAGATAARFRRGLRRGGSAGAGLIRLLVFLVIARTHPPFPPPRAPRL